MAKLKRISEFWKNLSISKKLYLVFGVMAMLIALELSALAVVMHTLSALRAFVGGEGLWSKAQKDAVVSLQEYIISGDPTHYHQFHEHLQIPLWGADVREALEKDPPDENKIYEGFLRGGIHEEDIKNMIVFMTTFTRSDYVQSHLDLWVEGDKEIEKLLEIGRDVHDRMQKRALTNDFKVNVVEKLGDMNARLTKIEIGFSNMIGEASRLAEDWVWITFFLLVVFVEISGLFLILRFSRYLSATLSQLTKVAAKIGQGDFSHTAQIKSEDELGQLAHSINRMLFDLKRNVGLRVQAEQLSQIKSLFLANMSHEIRTPLGTIMGFSELMADPSSSVEDRAKFAKSIRRSGENLTRIISDILDISKVEAGNLSIQYSAFSVREFLQDLETQLLPMFKEKGIELVFETAASVPDVINTDSDRLRQILTNLLHNAMKFTARGRVALRCTFKEGQFVFDIHDTGSGIEPERRDDIFEAFNRVGRGTGSTGLGLHLSRRLAGLLGGQVELVSSEVGKGSHFSVRIASESISNSTGANEHPIDGSASIPGRDGAGGFGRGGGGGVVRDGGGGNGDGRAYGRVGSAANGQVGQGGHRFVATSAVTSANVRRRVLVAEDSEDNRALFRVILDRLGYDCEFADDGSKAVEMAMSNPNFEMVLMDIQMPVMDGYEATVRLRQLGFKKPIVAVTAYAMKDDRSKCLRAGCTDYITKPLQRDELQRVLTLYQARA